MELEHEYTAIVPPMYEDDGHITIGIDKIGGGTLGSSYEGSWSVVIYVDHEAYDQTLMQTGTPKRHDEVAAIAGQFLAASIDEVDNMEKYDRLTSWASDVLGEND